jgi:hypothetical protein
LSDDVTIRDISDDCQAPEEEQPHKRAAIGDETVQDQVADSQIPRRRLLLVVLQQDLPRVSSNTYNFLKKRA